MAVRLGEPRIKLNDHLHPHFWTDLVLVPNEMALLLELDCPSDRVRETQGN